MLQNEVDKTFVRFLIITAVTLKKAPLYTNIQGDYNEIKEVLQDIGRTILAKIFAFRNNTKVEGYLGIEEGRDSDFYIPKQIEGKRPPVYIVIAPVNLEGITAVTDIKTVPDIKQYYEYLFRRC